VKTTSSPTPAQVLSNLPIGLRDELLRAFGEVTNNFRQERWEPSELNGGKLCEIVYSILRGHVDGKFPRRAAKPTNMVDACRALEQSSGHPRSVRIQIPRMLVALYEIRNNRGVGHVGGDIDANHMDAVAVLYMSKWILAELVRLFHGVDTDTATRVVDALVEREVPWIWVVGDRKRVLVGKITMKDKVMLLMHSETTPVAEADLFSWAEHSNPSAFRRDVLRPAHKALLIDYDASTKLVTLSPRGVRYAEDLLSRLDPIA
jgi:hypothetical protein